MAIFCLWYPWVRPASICSHALMHVHGLSAFLERRCLLSLQCLADSPGLGGSSLLLVLFFVACICWLWEGLSQSTTAF